MQEMKKKLKNLALEEYFHSYFKLNNTDSSELIKKNLKIAILAKVQ